MGHVRAYDINDAGQATGWAYTPTRTEAAVLWDGGVAYDLNDLIQPGTDWELDYAYSINNWGDICGVGTNGLNHGDIRAFVALRDGVDRNIPEPAAGALFLAGLAGLALKRRRK